MGWQTLWRTVAGLGWRCCGHASGHGDGLFRIARDALYPLLVGFNAIPKATLVPVIALIFIGQHDFNTC
jgi:NitT/TauT family transport system permease protein